MRLTFSQPYLSIQQFEPIELPNFAVVTGVNGSGKSHLLQAIEAGKVQVEGLSRPRIVRFNYETFKLDNEGQFNAQQIAQEKETAWQLWTQQVVGSVRGMRSALGGEYVTLLSSVEQTKKPFWEQEGSNDLAAQKVNLDAFFKQPNFINDQRAHGIYALVRSSPELPDEIDHDEFFSAYRPYTYKADFLPTQLGRVFWDYYEKFERNGYRRYQNETRGTQHSAMSDEEFIAKFGEKPWKIVNEILQSFSSLDYEVVSPEGLDVFGSYQIKLKSKSDPRLLVDFSSLSSGEQILLALVATVYKISSDRHFPGLLLLDEIDASLHPSMMRNLLQVIETIFLKRNVAVILVTHSPTTIALAPEDGVFVMRKQNSQPRISKESRGQALSILTEGFATLDEGLKILDEVASKPISVFTEGNNAEYLSLFFELSGLGDVYVVRGLEGTSGKNQLKTLFEFFARVSHNNKALFVWDCDVKFSPQEQNNTYAFFLPKNEANSICRSGIENAFPEQLFEPSVLKTITLAKKEAIREFDLDCKADFAQRIIGRRDIGDFSGFASLADKVRAISEVSRNGE